MTDRGGRVTLASGKVLEADHVLLTAPPPVVDKIAFEPALPPAWSRRWARTSSS